MKNKSFKIVGLVLALIAKGAAAQEITFSEVLYDIEGSVQAYSITESFDGNYMIAGHHNYGGLILKLGPSGNFIWAKRHSEYDVIYYRIIKTSDSCFVLSGGYINQPNYDLDIICTKIDQSGAMIWSKLIDTGINETALSVNENDDQGYILTGYSNEGYPDPDKIIVARLGSGGNLIWITRGIGDSDYNYGYSAKQIPDGGFIVTGLAGNTSNNSGACLVKFLEDGNIEWFKKLQSDSFTSSFGYDFVVMPEGLLCSVSTGNIGILLLQTDFSGNITWNKGYDGFPGLYGYLNQSMPKLRPSKDGGFFCVTPGDFGILLKTDNLGNLVFIKSLILNPADVLETPDNGFLVIGNGPLIGVDKVFNPQIGIIKTDSLGNETECVSPINVIPVSVEAGFIDIISAGTGGGATESYFPTISDIQLTDIAGCVDVSGGEQDHFSNPIELHPNPANKFVHILAGAGGPPKIESLDVINSVGENIFQLITGTLPLTIDVGGFNNGIYFLVIRKEEEIIVRKLLIRH